MKKWLDIRVSIWAVLLTLIIVQPFLFVGLHFWVKNRLEQLPGMIEQAIDKPFGRFQSETREAIIEACQPKDEVVAQCARTAQEAQDDRDRVINILQRNIESETAIGEHLEGLKGVLASHLPEISSQFDAVEALEKNLLDLKVLPDNVQGLVSEIERLRTKLDDNRHNQEELLRILSLEGGMTFSGHIAQWGSTLDKWRNNFDENVADFTSEIIGQINEEVGYKRAMQTYEGALKDRQNWMQSTTEVQKKDGNLIVRKPALQWVEVDGIARACHGVYLFGNIQNEDHQLSKTECENGSNDFICRRKGDAYTLELQPIAFNLQGNMCEAIIGTNVLESIRGYFQSTGSAPVLALSYAILSRPMMFDRVTLDGDLIERREPHHD